MRWARVGRFHSPACAVPNRNRANQQGPRVPDPESPGRFPESCEMLHRGELSVVAAQSGEVVYIEPRTGSRKGCEPGMIFPNATGGMHDACVECLSLCTGGKDID
jgi:hypothetical protein